MLDIIRSIGLLLVLISAHVANGSLGDRDWRYRTCFDDCVTNKQCAEHLMPIISIPKWDCEDVCFYVCAQEVTEMRLAHGLSPLKYYGHWTFIRWFGLEEPASVLFSLLNPLAHMWFLSSGVNDPRFHNYGKRNWIRGYAILAINAWLASACYHSKRTRFSTLYDLNSALTLLIFGFAMSISYFCGAVLDSKNSRRVVNIVCLLLALFWGYRVAAMINDEVEFSNHMNLCIFLVVGATVSWVAWVLVILNSAAITDKSSAYWCLFVQIWLMLAALLEVLDFPPYLSLFDAHSLWHAATVPLGFVWYKFVFTDMSSTPKPTSIKKE